MARVRRKDREIPRRKAIGIRKGKIRKIKQRVVNLRHGKSIINKSESDNTNTTSISSFGSPSRYIKNWNVQRGVEIRPTEKLIGSDHGFKNPHTRFEVENGGGAVFSRLLGEKEYDLIIEHFCREYGITRDKIKITIYEAPMTSDEVLGHTIDRSPKFTALLKKMKEIHDKKNRDYASDSDPFSNFGFSADVCQIDRYKVYLVLLSTKIARLHELLSKGKSPQNESINDTFLDFAVYAALMAADLGEF